MFPGGLPSESKISSTENNAPKPDSQISEQLTASISQLPTDLLNLLKHLPEEAPSASSDPEAAFSLHQLLSKLDVAMASRWHWRDTRKVLRSLQIVKQHGKLASDLVAEQSINSASVKPR